MDDAKERLPLIVHLPTLEELRIAADAQIDALMQQRSKLDGIATDLQQLIQAYNAQKSLLGHAAHWYGEQVWWLRIVVSIVAAGIAILLYIPSIISIALSLALSFFLLDHHAVATMRDRLITEDLVAQNHSVHEMISLLNGTRENLEHGLKVLCKMNQDMGIENGKLRENVASVTQQVAEYRALNASLNDTIKELQSNEEHLNLQLVTLSEQLLKYQNLVASGSVSYAQESEKFKQTTQSFVANGKELQSFTDGLSRHVGQFPTMTLLSSTHSSPEEQRTSHNETSHSAIRDSKRVQEEIDGINFDASAADDDYLAVLESQEQSFSPQRVTGLGPSGTK